MALISFTGAPHGGRQRHLPEWQSQPTITPRTIINHSIVGSGEGGFRYFRDNSVLESHFIVENNGEIWQLMDTAREADANLNANAYAISIETGDHGDPDNQLWNQAQLESLVWLHEKLIQTHPTIPRRKSRSCADPAGFGYHTLHGAPSCWTPVAKTCPGRVRKIQWNDFLLPTFLNPGVTDVLTDEDKVWLEGAMERSTVRGVRWTDHGDPTVQGASNHLARTRADIDVLEVLVRDLPAAVVALLPAPIPGGLTKDDVRVAIEEVLNRTALNVSPLV